MCLYVRELTLAEGRRLTRVLKTTKTAAYLRRAQVVAFSGQGMRARAIAGRLYLHEEYVRALIRRFNTGGFAALRPRKASGRPSKYAPEEVSVILEVAGTRPHDLGLPFTVWSLRKLAAHLVRCGVVKEQHATTLGRMLRDQGFSFQRTKTWKESPDPDVATKTNASVRSTRDRSDDPSHRSKTSPRAVCVCVIGAVAFSACDGDSPTSPSSTTVTGTWTGSIASTLSGPATARVTLAQSGSSITGTWFVTSDIDPSAANSGTLSGTFAGSALSPHAHSQRSKNVMISSSWTARSRRTARRDSLFPRDRHACCTATFLLSRMSVSSSWSVRLFNFSGSSECTGTAPSTLTCFP